MTQPNIDPRQLGAFVDGELDLSRQLEIEKSIEQDAAARAGADSLRRLRETVRNAADYHPAPAALRERLAAQFAAAPASDAQASAAGSATAPRASGRGAVRAGESSWQRWFAWRPMGLSLAFSALLAWGVGLSLLAPGADERLAQDAIASHVRATLGQRLVDVESSDQHTVKPWLSARLDFSPPVHDLPVHGLVAVGGRIDYLDGHPVAVLVYKQREHVIDAFVWPTREADSAVVSSTRRGFNVQHWSRGGMTWWLVSDLNRDELAVVARALEAS
jgi:anti-sigma factor RsiW